MSGMNDNLPPGCSQAELDRALNWDDEYPPEETEEELQAEYEERIELCASLAPENVFHECELPVAPYPMSAPGWSEFRQFLAVLSDEDVQRVGEFARAEVIARKPAARDFGRLRVGQIEVAS